MACLTLKLLQDNLTTNQTTQWPHQKHKETGKSETDFWKKYKTTEKYAQKNMH